MEFTRRWTTWHNKPTQDTPADAAFYQGAEDALVKLLGVDTPAVDEVGVWTPGSGGLIYQKIDTNQIADSAVTNAKLAASAVTNAKVDAAAAIAKSKLAALGIVDADVSSISQSKIAFDAWQTYTPTWAGSGTNPAIGNGSISGRYVQVGKTVHVLVQIVMGSTTTFGTGFYTISLPVVSQSNIGGPRGFVQAIDASPSNVYLGAAVYQTNTTLIMYTLASPTALYAPAVPITWASGDILMFQATYEAA